MAKVDAVDRLNVRFTLKEPQPYFLELFTPSSMIVYSKKALDENNQDLRKVIAPGTGAFMFKERKVAEKWVMVRNPNYWDPEIPYLDGIELLHIPAWTDRGTAVLTGQADYSPNVSLERWMRVSAAVPAIRRGASSDPTSSHRSKPTKSRPRSPLIW